MGKITVEQAIIASQPQGSGVFSVFTTKTLHLIRARESYELLQKKHTRNWTRLWHLPKFALAIVVVVVLAIASGTAYATYILWPKPAVHINNVQQNQFGRQEAVIDFEHCHVGKDTSYELKMGVNLPPEELTKILEARCERAQIDTWVDRTLMTHGDFTKVHVIPGGVGTITHIDEHTMTIESPNAPDLPATHTIPTDIQFIIDGSKVDRMQFKVGDPAVYVLRNTYETERGGTLLNTELVAVVKLNLPLDYYTYKQSLITERKPCYGNPDDSCRMGSAVPLYPRGAPLKQLDPDNQLFEIEGKLLTHHGAVFTIQGTSGKIYTVTAPYDVITDHNANYSATYDNIKVAVGDVLKVDYLQHTDADHTAISSRDLSDIVIVIDLLEGKDGPLYKY
ncbi:MAG TPA: hypothetical protein VM581_02975 [Magnetospirillaceae bacterium]|nr:hypothetical protein [Magnetospirillaceae bacterium]